MKFVDTQIVSYALKREAPTSLSGCHVSSIALSEFLECHGSDSNRANYYIPLLTKLTDEPNLSAKFRELQFGRRHTDQLIFDFGIDFPPLLHFGNLALSCLVNENRRDVFSLAVNRLPKKDAKRLAKRFAFLLNTKVAAVPLNRKAVSHSLDLFLAFCELHVPKLNLRNTLNDIMILATAAQDGATLLTRDSLLKSFAAERCGATVHPRGKHVAIDFPSPERITNVPRESKNFVNRGWGFHERNVRNARANLAK